MPHRSNIHVKHTEDSERSKSAAYLPGKMGLYSKVTLFFFLTNKNYGLTAIIILNGFEKSIKLINFMRNCISYFK
jgi:hypothetical protein